MKSINLKENQFIQFHQKISFKFDGVKYFGYKGDTIASALLRNNINLVGRSFKYHRPRGIYTCGIEEPNALVQIISEYSEPNTRATIKKMLMVAHKKLYVNNFCSLFHSQCLVQRIVLFV